TLVADEDVHEDRGDSVERVATTATSLDAEQGSGNINRTQSTAIPNDPFPQGIGLGGSPNRQDTILGDRPTQTRFERFSKHSNGLPLSRVNTVGSGEDSMTLQELMVFCTTLSKKVESLETDLKRTKQLYGVAYTRLIKKGMKIDVIDQDPGISLVQHDAEIQGRYEHDMEFDFYFDAAKEVSTTKKDVSTVSLTRNTRVPTADDITMAETIVYIRKSAVKDKAELEEEERQRIAMVHEAASSFYVEEWEDIQARSLSIKERGGYTLQQLRGYSFDEIKTLLETTMRSVNTFVPIESEVDRAVPELAAGNKELDELSQEELQQMMIIVLEQGMNVKDLQSKYPIIDWEIYTEGTRKYWKIIRVRNHTEEVPTTSSSPLSLHAPPINAL
ncbi:hypothetical protein Tco_1453955, partial [Tanacetum coccineum]